MPKDKKRKIKDKKRKIWIAVQVWRGIPVKVKGFRKRAAGAKQARLRREDMNPDYDEAGVFEIRI